MARVATCAMLTLRREPPRAAVSKYNPCLPPGQLEPCITVVQSLKPRRDSVIADNNARYHPIYDQFASQGKGTTTGSNTSNVAGTSTTDTTRETGHSATDSLRPHTQLGQTDEISTASIKSGVVGHPQGVNNPSQASTHQSNTVLPDRTATR